jgi:hypothetical protein
MTIMPGFDRHPEEATLIGRLLVAFGEVEVTLAVVVGNVGLQNLEQGLRAVYKVGGMTSRLELADALLHPRFSDAGLESDYTRNKLAIGHCKTIRNKFAHCIWADDSNPGIYFTDLEEAADRPDMLSFNWKHVDTALLMKQLEYFDNTLNGIIHLEHQWLKWAGKKRVLDSPVPKELDMPPAHNLASQHVPLWLNEDEKRRHLELALAVESVGQQPQRPPSILRLTREEWAAKDAKDARLAGES